MGKVRGLGGSQLVRTGRNTWRRLPSLLGQALCLALALVAHDCCGPTESLANVAHEGYGRRACRRVANESVADR